jgi:ankyrin repeat protein
VNEANNRGWTPLHEAAYANNPQIARLLISKGAALDAETHGSGGTPLVVSLFWGHRDVGGLLGRYAVAPRNLRVAAGLGIPESVDACFTGERTLTSKP